MKVIHYIPDASLQAGPVAQRVLKMAASASRMEDSVLVTSGYISKEREKALLETYKLRIVQLPRLQMNSISKIRYANTILKSVIDEEAPDVVHIHGSWDPLLALMEHIARKHGIVTCISPHGGLSNESYNMEFFKKRLIPFLLYQAPMIRYSTSMLVDSNEEWNDVSRLNLKRRVEILPPLPEDTDNRDEYSRALLAAYRKAIDSSYTLFLTKEEQNIVQRIVMTKATEKNETPIEFPEGLDTKGMSFKRLFFYAYDEDVLETFHTKALQLGLYLPALIDVASFPRYVDRKAKKHGDILQLPQSHRTTKLNGTVNPAERNAVEIIARVQKEKLSHLTLRHKVELYELFHNVDFDEDIVAEELKRLHLKRFTRKIQRMLHKTFLMPEGYDIF